MKIYSNSKVTDPGKKKKGDDPNPNPTYTPGKTKKTYTSGRSLTGHKDYGKENPKNKDAKFIEDARAKKQDIAYKDGKPYRAGYTTETREEGTFTPGKIPIPKPTIKIKVTSSKPEQKPVKKEVKATNKKSGKLKPMGMTYGTDSPKKGGGTAYKKKVRGLLNR